MQKEINKCLININGKSLIKPSIFDTTESPNWCLDFENRLKSKVIVAITRQGWLNKLGAFILNEPEAHTNFNLTPKQSVNRW